MEPKFPMPSSPEMGGYKRPEMPKPPERRPEDSDRSIEHTPKVESEPRPPAMPADSPAATVQLPVVPVVQPQSMAAQPQPVADNNPIAAADEDLIEKEWVTKAKQIIQNTKSDPYQQETEVSKLQADYLKKRYGKDVKLGSS